MGCVARIFCCSKKKEESIILSDQPGSIVVFLTDPDFPLPASNSSVNQIAVNVLKLPRTWPPSSHSQEPGSPVDPN